MLEMVQFESFTLIWCQLKLAKFIQFLNVRDYWVPDIGGNVKTNLLPTNLPQKLTTLMANKPVLIALIFFH